jgi:hypothetical protein
LGIKSLLPSQFPISKKIATKSLAVSCFAIFPAFYRASSRNCLIPILILVGDDIRLKLRPFELAVLGNRAFTLFTRQAHKGNCARGRLPVAIGWIPSSLFYPLFLLRLSNPAMHTCSFIRIVCDSAAAVSPQTPPTNKKLRAQVCPFYQSSKFFLGSTSLSHSKIAC